MAVIEVVRNDFIPINSNEKHKKGLAQRRLTTTENSMAFVWSMLFNSVDQIKKNSNKQAHSFYGALKNAGFTS